MHVLGLTGSIGMGKSTVANAFRSSGIAVYDADSTVHELMSVGGAAVEEVGKVFPTAIKDGTVDRQALGEIVYDDRKALEQLECILHPLARDVQFKFLQVNANKREKLVVLDIPLLYEKHLDLFCDTVIVVTAPYFIQKQRVLGRPGMTKKRFYNILKQQMPNGEKKKRADFIIQTGLNKREALSKINRIITETRREGPFLWSRHRIQRNA